MTARKKVTVVGAGFVGATTAQRLVDRQVADVVLTDLVEGIPAGRALDLFESTAIGHVDVRVRGISTAEGYEDTAGSDVIVITAGYPRRPGMTRDDLLKTNYDAIKSVVEPVARLSPDAIIIMVTNPLDAMAQAAYRISGFPKERVIGMAGVLDSARMSTFVAEDLGVSVENVQALVLGSHGDTMVPLPRYTTVAGIPLTELLSRERIDAIIQRTRNGGGEIVNLLKTGGAFYAPAAAIVQMVEAILQDKKQILPCAVYLDGEYGIRGVFVGVPVKLGARGAEQIVTIPLTAEESAALQTSAAAVRDLVTVLAV